VHVRLKEELPSKIDQVAHPTASSQSNAFNVWPNFDGTITRVTALLLSVEISTNKKDEQKIGRIRIHRTPQHSLCLRNHWVVYIRNYMTSSFGNWHPETQKFTKFKISSCKFLKVNLKFVTRNFHHHEDRNTKSCSFCTDVARASSSIGCCRKPNFVKNWSAIHDTGAVPSSAIYLFTVSPQRYTDAPTLFPVPRLFPTFSTFWNWNKKSSRHAIYLNIQSV